MSQLMRTLNNLFIDEEALNEFKTFLTDKNAYKFINGDLHKKFSKEPIYKKLKLINNQIVYVPKNLIVIETEEQKQQVLEELFTNDENTIGKGVTNLYKYVTSKYININRDDVTNFLQTRGYYQMTRDIKKRTNKPIVAKYPNQIWGIDLIDVNQYIRKNSGWRYIMTVVDIFSRKVFLNKLKTKDAPSTTEAFNQIIEDNKINPNYLMSDRGTEWLGVFAENCKTKKIKQLLTRSYSPQANGVVERMNKEVRKIMRAFFVRNQNNRWVDILDNIAENKNMTFNSSVKNAPNEIWTPDKVEIPENEVVVIDEDEEAPEQTNEEAKLTAKISLIKKAMDKIRKFRELDRFRVGDIVRVKMSSIFSNVRKLVKDDNTAQIVVTYTPELFVVHKVVTPRKRLLERRKYILKNGDGRTLTKNKVDCMFYGSELLKFNGDNANDIDIDMVTALRLNGVEPSATDVRY